MREDGSDREEEGEKETEKGDGKRMDSDERGKYQSKRERERPEGGKELNISSGGG